MKSIGRTWKNWFEIQIDRRRKWVEDWENHLLEEASEDAKSKRKMHPLQLGVDIISEMNDDDWLVFDGGNTHFWN